MGGDRDPAVKEQQYKDICAACHSLLAERDATIDRLAIPWLHVIREHPVFLENYLDVTEPSSGIGAMRGRVALVARYMAGWVWQAIVTLRSNGMAWDGPKEPPQVDVLFVSHLLSAAHAGRSEDFYFGRLPEAVACEGKVAAVALVNYSGESGVAMAAAWRQSPVARFVLSHSLGLSEEFGLFLRLLRESLRLTAKAAAQPSGLIKRVTSRSAQEALSGGARRTLRMADQLGRLVAQLKPKAIVVTYEGHAWERIAFAAARRVAPGIQCIGYQHAALFRLQYAIRQRLAPEYNPDAILTAGAVGKAQLESAQSLRGVPVAVVGSNRAFAPGVLSHARGLGCVVIPEGIASECHLLFEFSLECARACPAMTFIWRLHPLLTFEALVRQNPRLMDRPSNVVLSRGALEDDLKTCRWALYRGTTAVTQAVGAGLRPVYLRVAGEMTIDPLFALDAWRVVVEGAAEFRRVVDDDMRRVASLPSAEEQAAAAYCSAFFVPVNAKVLMDVIR